MKNLDKKIKKILLGFQRNEITEHYVYKQLAELEKGHNKKILRKIADDELRHYGVWRKYTGEDVKPSKFKILKYILASKIMGLTFALRSMEGGENSAQKAYKKVVHKIPEARKIILDEEKHESRLIRLINEESLNYIGSMVLGLNDALVELTGTIAGLTFALLNTSLVGIAALITGIAAALSMASSEYLSKKSENDKHPIKSSTYTGFAYLIAVMILVAPYFIFDHYYYALGFTLFNALMIIWVFTYFISVVKEESFRSRFLEMVVISFGVAGISFFIGLGLRLFLGIDV